jgi:archaellin
MPPSGDYLPCIASVDAMVVINFGFWSCVQKARNGPSTQLIEATSCVERSNATMKAKEHR